VGGGAALVGLRDGNRRRQRRRRQQGVDIGEGGGERARVLLALLEGDDVVARGDGAAELDARPHVRIGRLRLVVDEVADEPVALGADDAPGGGGVVAQAMGQRHPDDLRAQRGERVDGGVVRGLPFQR
jgi:hypothetical protein